MDSILNLIPKECDIYIESGLFLGESLRAAATLSQWNALYSIELNTEHFNVGRTEFKKDNRVTVCHGDSTYVLPNILDLLAHNGKQHKICVFLDGHYSGGGTSLGEVASPIEKELQTLVKYKNLIHTVIIDDVDTCFEIAENRPIKEENKIYKTGWIPIDTVKQYLLAINPTFKINVDLKRRAYGILYTSRGLPNAPNATKEEGAEI